MKIPSPDHRLGPNRILAMAYVLIVMAFFGSGESYYPVETEVSDLTASENYREPFSQQILAPVHDLLDLHHISSRSFDADNQRFRLIEYQFNQTSILRICRCQTTFLSIKPSLLGRLILLTKKGGDPPLPA